MAMVLDAFVDKCCTLLADYVQQEVNMLLGVKDELQKLLRRMRSIQSLLKDAENRRFDESSTDLWLSELKDVMYDADDIIDLCRIEGAQLLDDQNSTVRCNLSSAFSSAFACFDCFANFTSVPLRHEIGNRIKELNDRLDHIYEDRKRYKLEKSTKPESSRITLVDSRQTSSMVDPLVVGREVEDAANRLVHCLVAEKIEEKCRLFAVVGMAGIGKTTLAQKVFNHKNIKENFNLKIWVCVSQTYSEVELLQHIIREAKGSYGNANTQAELLPRLSDSVSLGQSLFLVLDDVWRADVWDKLLRVPLYNADTTIRVLVTTRYKGVAKSMEATHIHSVKHLSEKSSWDMLRTLVFHNGEDEKEIELKGLGFKILKKCGYLPLAIKTISSVLKKERTQKAWDEILSNKAWSLSKLPEELRGALYLSFEDLPSNLKQCFLYFSLYREDAKFYDHEFECLWVAEGFVTEQRDSLMEDLAKKYFKELLWRNLLQPLHSNVSEICTIHDLTRSLALFLSEEESSFKNENMKNSATSTKLRRLSIANDRVEATRLFDLIANLGAMRTLLASNSNLLLNDERLSRLSCLRVLDISGTFLQILPDSIGNLVHLRYLNLSFTQITTIPESIEHLANLQFLKINNCNKLRKLPGGIILLNNLRHLQLYHTNVTFIPKGIGKLKLLNELYSFMVDNNDSSSQLEELNSLKQIRRLSIEKLEGAKIGTLILRELSYLFYLKLYFTYRSLEKGVEEQLAVEKLFDDLIPPSNLEQLEVMSYFGRRFPNWMDLSTFERCVPHLTVLCLWGISSCTQLPSLGQLPKLRKFSIEFATKVKKIGPEFLGGGVHSVVNSSTRIAFPKLNELIFKFMDVLDEWSFGVQVEENASPRLKLLPCLEMLHINNCRLLKQLPKSLKHSPMKLLEIFHAHSLELLDNLPDEIESLNLHFNEKLEKVYCPPTLKNLSVKSCKALFCVGKFDELQYLHYFDENIESLPEWLLILLQQRGPENDSNENFELDLMCPEKVIKECLKGGFYWNLIQHIPRVSVKARLPSKSYLRYNKQIGLYDTNL